MNRNGIIAAAIVVLVAVAALWLLKRFEPSLKKSHFRFVPTSASGVKLPAHEIGVGVGRGKYDEHKGDLKDSAASLVWHH